MADVSVQMIEFSYFRGKLLAEMDRTELLKVIGVLYCELQAATAAQLRTFDLMQELIV